MALKYICSGDPDKVRSRGLILYDLDGTLVDSRADLAAAVNAMRASYNAAPVPLDFVVKRIGLGQRSMVELTSKDIDAPLDERINRLRSAYAACLLRETRLYPGVAETLAALQAAGWHQGMLTNKNIEAARPILEGLGVVSFFKAVTGAEPGAPLKPDPAAVELAIRRTGWDRNGPAWMVGDHYTDLEAGRRSGLQRCFCRYGFGWPGEETWELAVDRLDELARHLGVAVAVPAEEA